MARMTSADMRKGHDGPVNPITGTHRQVSPAEAKSPKPNVKGDAGLPSGRNGDGDPMTGGSCY